MYGFGESASPPPPPPFCNQLHATLRSQFAHAESLTCNRHGVVHDFLLSLLEHVNCLQHPLWRHFCDVLWGKLLEFRAQGYNPLIVRTMFLRFHLPAVPCEYHLEQTLYCRHTPDRVGRAATNYDHSSGQQRLFCVYHHRVYDCSVIWLTAALPSCLVTLVLSYLAHTRAEHVREYQWFRDEARLRTECRLSRYKVQTLRRYASA